MHILKLKIPIGKKFRDKIEIAKTHNHFCRKFNKFLMSFKISSKVCSVCEKIATSCPNYDAAVDSVLLVLRVRGVA